MIISIIPAEGKKLNLVEIQTKVHHATSKIVETKKTPDGRVLLKIRDGGSIVLELIKEMGYNAEEVSNIRWLAA
jgi:hypothetical protein